MSGKLKIKEAYGNANGFPEQIEITLGEKCRKYVQINDQFYWCFAFANWLENLPKGAVGGAAKLLRIFLREKKLYDDE